MSGAPLPFSSPQFLKGSLYYPASGVDGSVIRQWRLGFSRFVHADTSIDERELLDRAHEVAGYTILNTRALGPQELAPPDWDLQAPEGTDAEEYLQAMNRAGASPATAYAILITFQRTAPESHGPEQFSLLHLRAEGAAAYQALYRANNILPGAVAIIRPGEGFGLNYNNFQTVLCNEMREHPLGMPTRLLMWDYCENPRGLSEPWTEFYNPEPVDGFPKDGEPNFRIYVFERR